MGSVKSSKNSRKNPSSEVYHSEARVSFEELVLVPPTQAKVPVKEVVEPIPEDDERRADPRNIRQLRRMR